MNMMKWGVATIVIVLFLIIFLNKGRSKDDSILDSFEGRIDTTTVDFGTAAGTSLKVEASKDIKACGMQSLKLEYDLKPGGYMFAARGYNLNVKGAMWEGPEPKAIEWTKYSAIGFQLFGSKSGTIAFDVKDAGGEYWRYLIKDDFEGWRDMVVPFNQFKARDDWQPKNADGNLKMDFPVQSFQWEPKTSGTGTIYVDCVKLQ